MLNPTHHRWIYLICLSFVAVGLPFSKAIISIGEIGLALNFLLEGNLSPRVKKLFQRPTILLFVGLFVLHIVGLFWTSDFAYAFQDIRVKLPLLLFPIVVPAAKRLTQFEFRGLLLIFVSAVIFSSFLSTAEYLKMRINPSVDFREISLFTSHIRYALMVCLAYLTLLYLAWYESNKWRQLLYFTGAVWTSVFVFVLQSMTGVVVWLVCSYMLLFYTMFFIKKSGLRAAAFTILIVTPLIMITYLIFQVDAYYPDQEPNFSELETHTAGGEFYKHDTTNLTLENGYYIHQYIAYHELETEWNKKSDIAFWGGYDEKGQAINSTLMRYLTSKGLRKDSIGINALTAEDVTAIEGGIANVRFLYGNSIDNRLYTIIWEFEQMMHEKNVQGHSVTQRLIFWKTGWSIFRENDLIGVGTGDVKNAFIDMHERMNSKLSQEYRLRTHNQYLTFAITFGSIGLVWFIVMALLPFFNLPHANSFLYIGFALVMYTSMLNEDTLETQTGVTLFAFFNAILLYGRPYDDSSSSGSDSTSS